MSNPGVDLSDASPEQLEECWGELRQVQAVCLEVEKEEAEWGRTLSPAERKAVARKVLGWAGIPRGVPEA
jgi:hypothetical protein